METINTFYNFLVIYNIVLGIRDQEKFHKRAIKPNR